MATMSIRMDQETEAALLALMEDGTSRSEAVRKAVLHAARLRQEDLLREEAQSLAADEVDRAEARTVLGDMEALRAW
jgi:Arc/MetJ-type ribon-helix-helix transcriptional regulator